MEILDFVEKVADKAEDLAKTAAKKTGAAANSAKIALELKNERSKLEKKYCTLGKLFYEQINGTDVRRQIVTQINHIDAQKATIADLRAQLDESRGKVQCLVCGERIDCDSLTCPFCGSRQSVAKVQNDTRTKEEIIDDIIKAPGLDTENFVSFFNSTSDK